jgi:hypothetical protein
VRISSSRVAKIFLDFGLEESHAKGLFLFVETLTSWVG